MLRLDNVQKSLGGRVVLNTMSVNVPPQQFTVILGRSGSGKSTLLRLMNRLLEPDSGEIYWNDQAISQLDPVRLRRGIGYVIQDFGLFPHWNVFDNIATVPRLLKWSQTEVNARVHELMALLELPAADFAKRLPASLSGGQQQRVGVARALAARPELLLMDEPFGALDPIIRRQAQKQLKHIQATLKTTMIMVTHDLDEAFACADHILVLHQGTLLQACDPKTLLRFPAHPEVENILGHTQRAFKLLSLMRAEELLLPGEPREKFKYTRVLAADCNGADILSELIGQTHCVVRIRRADGAYLGHVTLDALLAHATRLD
jgi:osmoprotectant transport system ATP-binding protein